MNGRELLEALSYIDEELLAASEKPTKKTPWRQWTALAACLCILILGVFSFRQMEKTAKTEAADQCAPEAMMAMGASQETYAAMEAAEEEPMAAGSDDAALEAEGYNRFFDADCAASESDFLRVKLIELTQGGFIAQVIGDEAEALTVTVLFTDGIRIPELAEGEEYFITVESAEEDGTLWVSAVEPAQED